MTRVCSVIERHRQIRLLGEGAEPFTVLIDEATKLPCRQFELDQSERRVTPSAASISWSSRVAFPALFSTGMRRAGIRDDIGDEVGGERRRKPKLLRQPVETVLVFGIRQHDTISQQQRS